MVRTPRLDLRPVDWLLLGYLAFVSLVILLRGDLLASGTLWLLVMHLLFATLLWLCGGSGRHVPFARLVHDFYPLIMLLPLYGEFGVLSAQLGREAVLAHDRVVQAWEARFFGGQPAYEWIRRVPSPFWSGLLHLAYFTYYVVIVSGPILLALRGLREAARRVLFATMVAFVGCYVVFVLYPVAGPYYTFPHPTGPVREVWSARVVYGLLAAGSSFGAAFPSSHVAATVAAALATRDEWPALGWGFVVSAAFLTAGTVYCQMHYAVDATAGLLVGLAAWALARQARRRDLLPNREPAA
jgi:membrane-associated phospholipid phosphatase